MEDQSSQEKKKTVAVMNKHFLEASRVTPGIFMTPKFKENVASLRNDTSQLNSRIAAPTKLIDYDTDQNVQTNFLLLVILSL